MDRLSTLVTLGALALLVGCGTKGDTPAAPTPSRTETAKVAQPKAASADDFCDLHTADSAAKPFHWPQLASAAPAAAKTWRWVNVWATWCEPCIEEMPRLAQWRDKLVAAGKPVELELVSVDDSDDDIAAFRKAHPGTPPSLRVATAEQRAIWLNSLGLSDGAIPIHLFVSADSRLRCARAGGLRDKDYAAIEKLLAE